jgi:hypothetical protein
MDLTLKTCLLILSQNQKKVVNAIGFKAVF